MSPDAAPQSPPPPARDPLDEYERRVLGVLIEKQKTSKSADSYPLSLNALTTGCNQKSNRDPVLDMTEDDADETLSALQKKGLVMRMTGGRVERFRHLLYEAWTRNGPQLAVLAELLLRGPQTKGDLRPRAGRMDAIDTAEALEDVLKPLVEQRLVVYFGPPDRRGTLLTHGFHTPEELARLRSQPADPGADGDAVGARRAATAPPADQDRRLTAAEGEIGELKGKVDTLGRQVAELRQQLGVGKE